jgi:cytochrome c oxidase assembly factor CtaG
MIVIFLVVLIVYRRWRYRRRRGSWSFTRRENWWRS